MSDKAQAGREACLSYFIPSYGTFHQRNLKIL